MAKYILSWHADLMAHSVLLKKESRKSGSVSNLQKFLVSAATSLTVLMFF